jgi:peptide deformylase
VASPAHGRLGAVTLLKIAHIGHPVLRQRAREVERDELLGAEMQRFIDDLVETMRDAEGAGLAAIQVHEPVRICAIEVRQNARYPYKPPIPLTILVNPVLTPVGDERFDNYEGCLSVPNLRGQVQRFVHLHVRAWDRHGNDIDEVVHGLKAGTYQHEVDHLDGKIFVDRVTDPTTFSTWTEFDRHHKAAFVSRVEALVAKVGS